MFLKIYTKNSENNFFFLFFLYKGAKIDLMAMGKYKKCKTKCKYDENRENIYK